MSRALDSDTASNLHKVPPQKVYEDIVAALNTQPSTGFLEIEFLGKSHPLPAGCNILIIENSIGVTKSKLVQAFVIARQHFFECVTNISNSNLQEIRDATAIMLLMDAENYTAANTRKRLIQICQTETAAKLKQTLLDELYWVNSILTSRLHRHTKSPTLWNHRRWILEVCQSIGMIHDIRKDFEEVILVAAERHPRNYYAWLHARWMLVNINGKSILDQSGFLSSVQDWCLRHPSDTSGFSFLLFCLSRLSSEATSRVETSSSVCKQVLGLAVSFRWTHESVWVFLRTLVASGEVLDEQRMEFLKSIQDLLTSLPNNDKPNSVLTSARDWYVRYQREAAKISTVVPEVLGPVDTSS
jgi:protein prenyltransferase alpha subunit repeat containing protein 1